MVKNKFSNGIQWVLGTKYQFIFNDDTTIEGIFVTMMDGEPAIKISNDEDSKIVPISSIGPFIDVEEIND